MKLSQLIKALTDAKDKFGDVPAKLMDSETGYYIAVKQVIKLHPYDRHEGIDYNAPVEWIGLLRHNCGTKDLVLAEIKPQDE